MQRTSPLMLAFDANSTAAAFAAFNATLTQPPGVTAGHVASGIYDLVPGGKGLVADFVWLQFFGGGAADATFDIRLWGWNRAGSSDPATMIWMPVPLASFTCTLSALTGPPTSKISGKLVDTIAPHTIAPQPFMPYVNATPAAEFQGTVTIFSPANDMPAWAMVPLYGCEKLQFDVKVGTATSGNAVFRTLNHQD